MCSKRKRPDVVLYHFCPAHMVEAIKREGLRLGAYPIFSENRMELIPNIQWLTAEPDRAKQMRGKEYTALFLLDVVNGTKPLDIGAWRKIGKALDKLESKAADG